MPALPRWMPTLERLNLPVPLIEAIRKIYQMFYDFRDMVQSAGGTVEVVQDMQANFIKHPAAALALGSRYIVTDRNRIEYLNADVNGANTWVYLTGIVQGTRANLLTGLTANDTGLVYRVTDFDHWLRWTGTGWQFPDGERSAYVQGFFVDPSPATGWQLCDGTAGVTYLKSDGTTGSLTVPDLVSAAGKAAYLKLGNPATLTANAAVAPTITGGTAQSNTTGITLPANTGSNTTGITNPATTGSGAANIGNDTDAGTTVTTSGAVSVALKPHAHVDSGHTHTIGAPTDPGHTHTEGSITDPGHTHTLTGISAGTNGEPQNIVMRPWFRR